ncbi:MAG TPA: thioesterase [Alphaproteobacteria bacterium]|nr:thioesterase [Alphaproteobacteria bacterium]HAJ47983.1 thioesterase [Alphaproteobacteria bacterium]
MNLFLRLVLAWLKGLRRPRLNILDECVSDFKVWFTDQDAFRHMTNSRYFSLTDVSIIDYMFRTKAWPKLRAMGWMPHITYEDMVFLKPLRWGQRFVIRTQFLGWDDDRVIARHIFERADGKIAAQGYTVARFVSMKGERIPTATVLKLLGTDPASPALSAEAQDIMDRALNGYRQPADRQAEAPIPVAA